MINQLDISPPLIFYAKLFLFFLALLRKEKKGARQKKKGKASKGNKATR